MNPDSLAYVMHATFLLSFASFAFRNVNYLRGTAIVASLFTIYYSFTASTDPLWVPILWHFFFILVNTLHLGLNHWRHREIKLTATENFLHKTVLSNFPPAEVRSFLQISMSGSMPRGKQLIKSGTELNFLFCITAGHADIYSQGEKIGELGVGRFVGEMSLLTQSKTRADVVAGADLKFLAWAHEAIEKWVDSDAYRLSLLQTALGTQVVEVLLQHDRIHNPMEGKMVV